MDQITVYKNRTTRIGVSLNQDVSADSFESDIRVDKDLTSDLIAEWDVTFLNDGVDGELVLTLTLTEEASTEITQSVGYMDIKRTSAGHELNVWDDPVEVLIQDPVTA